MTSSRSSHTSDDASRVQQLLEARAPVAFFLNGIGDRLLALPALRALVHVYGRQFTLACDETAAPFFRTQLGLSRIIEIPHAPGNRRFFDADVAAEAIGDCDLFLSLAPWSSDALARLVDAVAPRLSIGFDTVFDIALPRDYRKHSAELTFDVARALDPALEIDAFAAPLRFDSAVRRKALQLLNPLPEWIRVLTVHADSLREKMWPPERMAETIDSFLAQHGDFVVLFVGMADHALAGDEHGSHVVSCRGLPLDLSMRLVAVSDLFLGIDSCMLHAADLARVPGIGLFGPTSSSEFGFRFAPHQHLQATSMDEIDASEAADALGRVWSSWGNLELSRRSRADVLGGEEEWVEAESP